MSIVGPRPWIPEYYENFTENQKERTNSKPGIVGLAQVNGRRNLTIFKKIDYDIKYVKNINIITDIKIIIKSIRVLFSKEQIQNNEQYIQNEINMLKNSKNE